MATIKPIHFEAGDVAPSARAMTHADRVMLELARMWGDTARLYTPRGVDHLARAFDTFGEEHA